MKGEEKDDNSEDDSFFDIFFECQEAMILEALIWLFFGLPHEIIRIHNNLLADI